MSTKPPADPPMDRSANPVRPATAPVPRKPAAPPPPRSGFQRFVLQFLLLVIALGGAYFTGYHVNANEMLLERNDLQQQQLDAQERILALEKQIAELQERRESGNRVELDLTEVFEPIREAVGRIALVRMGEISREITTELTRLVEDDLTSLDDPTNATGGGGPGGMIGGSATPGRAPDPEAASAAGESSRPPTADEPDPLQPSSAALDVTEVQGQPGAVDSAEDAEDTEPAVVPAASNSLSVDEPAAAIELPASTAEAVSQEASRDAVPDSTAGRSGIVNEDGTTPREDAVVAELASPSPPNSPGGVPPTEP